MEVFGQWNPEYSSFDTLSRSVLTSTPVVPEDFQIFIRHSTRVHGRIWSTFYLEGSGREREVCLTLNVQ